MKMKNFNWHSAVVLTGLVCMSVNVGDALADRPAKEEFRERAAEQPREQRPVAQSSDWGVRLSPGVSVWMLDEEDTETAPALHLDVWRKDLPWNFRVGVEGQHVDLEQEEAAGLADGPGRQPRVTFVRIPFAVEYKHEINRTWAAYFGGGPDINVFANDASTTEVGAHLGARIHYAFNDHWGISVDGGYMWARIDEDDSSKVDLDGAYVTPLLTYTF